MSTVDRLARAKSLIVTHGWCREGFGNEKVGYCVLGAFNVVGDADDALYQAFRKANNIPYYVGFWNNEPARTKAEVLTAFDKAIEYAKGAPA